MRNIGGISFEHECCYPIGEGEKLIWAQIAQTELRGYAMISSIGTIRTGMSMLFIKRRFSPLMKNGPMTCRKILRSH